MYGHDPSPKGRRLLVVNSSGETWLQPEQEEQIIINAITTSADGEPALGLAA
jgi:hypothetical protein